MAKVFFTWKLLESGFDLSSFFFSFFFTFFFNLVCFEKKRQGNHNKDKKFMRWLEVSWWDQSYAVPARGKASSLLLALPWGWHPTSKLITQVVGEGQGFDVNPRAGNWILPSGAAWGWMQAPQCGGYERICTFVDFHRSIYKETSYVSKSRFLYPVSLSASLWFCCFREKPEAVFQVVINTLCTKPVCWLGVIKAFKERSLFPAKTLV